jgi:hypothetical protein
MSEVERTSAGLQIVIPGCEGRTLPKSTTRVDEIGQGLLHFYKPPSLREQLESRPDAPLRPSKGQKALPKSGLFSSWIAADELRLRLARNRLLTMQDAAQRGSVRTAVSTPPVGGVTDTLPPC